MGYLSQINKSTTAVIRLSYHGNIPIITMQKLCRNTNGIIRNIPLNKTHFGFIPKLPPPTSSGSGWNAVFMRRRNLKCDLARALDVAPSRRMTSSTTSPSAAAAGEA